MDNVMRQKILTVLDQHYVMTIATVRPDGSPQATMVTYVADDLKLYFLCHPKSQQAANVAHDDRLSLTILQDSPLLSAASGLSIAGHAHTVLDPVETVRILRLFKEKYRDQPIVRGSMLEPGGVCIVEISPSVISYLDNTVEFGHLEQEYC